MEPAETQIVRRIADAANIIPADGFYYPMGFPVVVIDAKDFMNFMKEVGLPVGEDLFDTPPFRQ